MGGDQIRPPSTVGNGFRYRWRDRTTQIIKWQIKGVVCFLKSERADSFLGDDRTDCDVTLCESKNL